MSTGNDHRYGNEGMAGHWNANWYLCEYGMLEYWNSGGCAGLGNLYIFTVVVVLRYDSN